MRIKSIDVTNGLQHAKLKADFTDFNVIIGPNGCGKSSVIELIGFALTNKFTWPGTLDTMIRQGEENGKVILTVEHEGDIIEITAALGRTSRKLVRGDLKIKRAGEVVEYIENVLLRTPFELVNEASIVRQGKLDAGLFTTQAKRQQIFQRLAGLNDIEAKRKQLVDAKAMCTPFMLSFDLDDKTRQLAELGERTEQLTKQHADLLATQPSQERYDQCKALLANLDNMKKYSAEQVQLTKEREQLTPVVVEAKTQHEQTKGQLVTMQTALEDGESVYTEALSTIARIEAAAKQVTERDRLTKQLVDTNASLAELVAEPDEFVDEAKIAEFAEIHAEACSQIKQAVRVRDNLSAEDKKCPTCGTELDDPSAIVASANATIEEMGGIGKVASAGLQDLRIKKSGWDGRLQAYRTNLAALQATAKSTQQSLESVAAVVGVDGDKNVCQRVVGEYSALSSAVTDVQKQCNDISEIFNDANSKLQVCETKLVAVHENLAGLGGNKETGATVAEAGQYVTACDEHKTTLANIEGQVTEVQRQRKEAEKQLVETKEKAKEAEKYKEFSDHIEFARSALHRDNFPSGKVKSFIDRVLANSEAYLEAMQAGFSVTYENEHGFIAHFPEQGRTMRADRLSGGEKVTFALAFRFAVNEVKSETGFLILDEPTAHLDDEHVDNVVRVLELVKRKLAGRVQLFVVTHNEKMAAVADTVLEINKASA